MTAAPGRLVTVEGLDGAGKTTLVTALSAALTARGVDHVALREPGGVPLAERLRAIVADPSTAVDARTEALLFAAARAQLCVERIEPELAAGRWVLLDRFVDSSLAYQGAGRGLDVDDVAAINRFATAGRTPDRTLLLRVSPAEGRHRLEGRAVGERSTVGQDDRIEQEGTAFFARVAAGYDALANAEASRFRLIDAWADADGVLVAALDALSDLLPPAREPDPQRA